MAGLAVGDRAPDFTLDSTRGKVTLSERLAKGQVLLVFYPGDDTPVCTRQLCDYRDHLEDFADLDVDVIAVNPQDLPSHERFAARHGLSFPLCADPDRRVCRAYGAVGLLGMTKRALVLIGKDGRVRWRRTDLPIFHRSANELREVIEELGAPG
jgi:peroxiredoxin Q/BCP